MSFGQFAQLIQGIGYVRELDDFTIKPLQQESLLLTGMCQHPSPRLSTSGTTTLPLHTKAHTSSNNAARTRLWHRRASRAVSPRLSTAAISDDDGCRSEDEQHRPSARKNTRWDEIDEQRLRVYKEKGKAWKWIFKKSPTRTEPAIRTRWTILQHRVK